MFSLYLDSPCFYLYSRNILRRVCGTCGLWKIVVFWVPYRKIVWDPKERRLSSGSLGQGEEAVYSLDIICDTKLKVSVVEIV